MAPALGGDWGSGAAALWLQTEQLVPVVSVSVCVGLLLVSALLMLCASCKGQKKAANICPVGDQENLVNGVSERETISQSAESPVTDAAVSTSHNGPLTSGTILSDTQDTSPQLSDEMPFSQSELRSSKYHQDRELPSIPPGSALIEDRPTASGDNTYEMVKDIATASRDVSVEDSLYETVKELKEAPSPSPLPNGTVQPSPDEPQPLVLLNGHVSPSTPEQGPLCEGVEYASVDLNKKSRHSADMEARRHSGNAATDPPSHKHLEEPEEDLPPPVPEKVLDENDNQPVVMNGQMGAGLHNGESYHEPVSLGGRPCLVTLSFVSCTGLQQPLSVGQWRGPVLCGQQDKLPC
ncbi:phosphoprotein associated with glycosphingolipid-enriched microdomains 1 isoform X2 [Kryptolebias marmoratus]|uniref:phosphoprotein associated with glycosphingolipid-enriched microdomains 1 isoform X2 n=1 Tax=Kryptolebias marmoratus TaxID=37003 RepID=UPI000D52F970|nr:phosphoprotein associated with glycosphingolipid-enriched microdomains 1 isoform X2 [Kryptolebias marmoratus]